MCLGFVCVELVEFECFVYWVVLDFVFVKVLIVVCSDVGLKEVLGDF